MKYRKLEVGETIQEGDEVLQDDEWQNVSLSIGDEVFIRYVFRRPLTTEQVANNFREKLAALMEEFGVSEFYLDRTTEGFELIIEGGWVPFHEGYSFTPESIRESITSPETGATEEE